MLTQTQIEQVKQSWSKVVPIAPQAATLFYTRLFELDPKLKILFKSNMTEQGQKLMAMITTAVNSLDQLERIAPAVQAMGRRHVGYGVEEAHYDTVGEALLWTLAQGLGDHFTPEVETAWAATYTVLADTMKAAAAQAA